MPHDFIAHSERIEECLKLAGFAAVAECFEDARLGGSTSGEILMGLRHQSLAAQSNKSLPADVRADMAFLVREIDATGI